MKIKLLTWNIWHGKHLDDVIAYLQSQNADIIALQEVVEKEANGKVINHAEEIAQKLGYYFTYCGAFTTDRHTPSFEQGNAVLSKFPLENEACHYLSDLRVYQKNAETEPRIAVTAQFKINNKPLHIVITHLGYSDGFTESPIRSLQLEELLPLLQKEHMVLMGDFNSTPQSQTIREVSKILKNSDSNPDKPTYSVFPNNYHGFEVKGLEYRIDYIFVSEDINVLNTTLGDDAKGSDHLPVISIIEV